MDYHGQSIAQLEKELQTNKETGLGKEVVDIRQKKHGKNVLPTARERVTMVKIFFDQWKSPLILILVVAGTISGFLGEKIDMTIIYITALLNALIGFFQEFKANKALSKLQSMVEYNALVLRDGKKQEVSSKNIVPGDILFLSPGDKIQADGRLIKAVQLEINEASLTGESEPIKKHIRVLKEVTRLGDRKNMVYRGTSVVNGEGAMLVTSIGGDTELGHIATLVKDTQDERTPLQNQLSKLGRQISIIVVAIAVGIFVIGFLFNGGRYHTLELFETAVAVAVAAIPEGLVISLTIILAIGMQFILRRRALMRKLVAAETLGSVDVICTDKTGTLTEGNMKVTRLVTISQHVEMDALAHGQHGSLHEDISLALDIGVLANNAILKNPKAKEKEWQFFGDTTETALIRAGMEVGIGKEMLEKTMPRLAEVPFSSNTKFMATTHTMGAQSYMYIKGAPEVLLKKAIKYQDGGVTKKMGNTQREYFSAQAEELASNGFRTLAVGYKITTAPKDVKEKDVESIVFVGIIALSDPLRRDVKKTITIAKKAGIRVIMITGDHASTASAIAKSLGIPATKKHVATGEMLDNMSGKELASAMKHLTVFARVDPKHKIRIVRTLQDAGHVVAMTGDGVNDAPALKGADIGIALGSGTDVAKETSDMVLLDDSFSTIVAAVEEGRTIYQNVKKVVLYLLSGSFAEVVMITGSILAGLPVAALPAQILWVNIIEDAFPNIALAFDKGDKENMQDPPRKKHESLIDKEMKIMIIGKSILANVLLFIIFVYMYKTTGDIALTRTIVFVGFAIDALFYIFSIRSLRHMIWQMNPFNNKYLLLAVSFGWVMLFTAIYWAPLQKLLRTVPLSLDHWIMMIGFGLFNIVLIESIKAVFLVSKKERVV
ncbi:MAG: HAD-IC family P-type ATPase [Candidatus Magasanikbacteria bacterium]|jgi:P-type Ca2+ transporter type 2C|nr:HAD-IC family P-type ATPase [Candidatus Magasanikbacteria bacterium]MBT4071299.1 HAD-IC family P-type ATPase [Candidatus Magasanikbacteria bacterium]